jgi:hypothetical protein
MAVQIVKEAFQESLGVESKANEGKLTHINDNGPVQYNSLKDAWGVSKPALSGWVNRRVRDGVLVWCDENGIEFSDDGDLKKAKQTGKAYVKTSDQNSQGNAIGLPSPYDLTGDPAWKEGGTLWAKYDLGLDQRFAIKVNGGLAIILHYPQNEPAEITADNDKRSGALKVKLWI